MIERTAYLLMIVCLVCTTGCSSSSGGSPLNTREDFDVWQTEENADAFRYVLTWYVPPDQLFGSKRNSFLANLGFGNDAVRRPYLSLNNEDKLRLEDYAVHLLDKKLTDKQLCGSGYKIEETRWQERSVILVGQCD